MNGKKRVSFDDKCLYNKKIKVNNCKLCKLINDELFNKQIYKNCDVCNNLNKKIKKFYNPLTRQRANTISLDIRELNNYIEKNKSTLKTPSIQTENYYNKENDNIFPNTRPRSNAISYNDVDTVCSFNQLYIN